MKEKQEKANLENVRRFMQQRNIAIVGVSAKANKFGNTIFKTLVDKGYNLFPVHQSLESFEGVGCFKTIGTLPPEVEALIICTKPDQTIELVKQANEKGIKHIWLQQGAQDDEAIEFARSENINIIHRECALMFAEPVTSIHKFHRTINKLFGAYPN
ncbi:MAG: CoA-binding protein [Bacteroidales bacterium]|nr:CoA-binding protein [Bacteroidales bacterium]